MGKIKIAITGRVASVVALPEVVADNAEYEVDFAFDPREGWDVTLPITALFVRRDGSYTPRIMDEGETSCTMPPQTGTNIVFVGLTQDDMRTTTPATIKVQRSIRTVAHDPLPAPSEDVYAQILAAYAGIKTLSGKGAPTSSTQGKVNQLYRDEDTQRLYICTAADGGYTWAAVSGGSVGVDTTLTKAGYAADAKAAGDAIGRKIEAPQTAQVGEVLTVEEVDEDGKPTKWKTAAAEQKQADWAQNDETAADYVKNRPLWKKTVNGVALPKTTTGEYGEGEYELKGVLASTDKIEVIFDEIKYECINRSQDDSVGAYGNLSLRPSPVKLDDTGEPFLVAITNNREVGLISANEGQHTIQINAQYTQFHSLDKEYMPEDITKVYLRGMDASENTTIEQKMIVYTTKHPGRDVSNEVVYDVDEKILRTRSTMLNYRGAIWCYRPNDSLPVTVGDKTTFQITDTESLDKIHGVAYSNGCAMLGINLGGELLYTLIESNGDKYTGVVYYASGYLYGVTITYEKNASSATVEVKRIL